MHVQSLPQQSSLLKVFIWERGQVSLHNLMQKLSLRVHETVSGIVNSSNNKKVLLRKRKRHSARCVSSTPSAVLSRGGGGYPISGQRGTPSLDWGYPLSGWGGGYPSLDVGSTPSLAGGTLSLGQGSVKLPVTISTMLSFDGDGNEVGKCKHTLTLEFPP